MSARAPMVSVVIPTWRGETYIAATLDSVLAQTYRDFELIVVNDGSPDGTETVLGEYGDRVRYVRQAHAGQSAARNHGAALARGEILAFLDHDDLWEPTFLERTVSYLEAHPDVGFAAAGVRLVTADGTPTEKLIRKRSPGTRYTTRSLLAGDAGTIHSPVVRKNLFEDAGGYDPLIRGPEDCDLWLKLSFLTEMHHLPQPLFLFRIHPDNFSKDILTNARQWLLVLENFEKAHPRFVREHRALMQRNWAKQLKRLGRELISRSHEDPSYLAEARQVLRRSISQRAAPKTYLYAALATVPRVAPLYSRWRRVELGATERRDRNQMLARWARSINERQL